MDSIGQVSNIACSNTCHTVWCMDISEWITYLCTAINYIMIEILPYTTITGHIYMEIISQTVNLFRCHPTVAKHANLQAKSNKILWELSTSIKVKTCIRGLPIARPGLLCAPMTMVSPNFQDFHAEKFSFQWCGRPCPRYKNKYHQ